jgi:hypothetical protein
MYKQTLLGESENDSPERYSIIWRLHLVFNIYKHRTEVCRMGTYKETLLCCCNYCRYVLGPGRNGCSIGGAKIDQCPIQRKDYSFLYCVLCNDVHLNNPGGSGVTPF